ncbi:MAG: hypothetical protein ABSB70_20565 [Candidatus Velthaea sp.]|jgi:hypothetical protein
MAGVFMCAGLLGTLRPASADTFSHLPTIDLYPSVNFATGNDEYGSPGGPDPLNNYGPPIGDIASPSAGNAAGGTRPGKLDLNAVVTIPLIKGLAFQYEHDRCCGIDTTIGRVTDATGKYVYPATSNDIVDAFRLNYSGIKGVSVSLATQYRFRHDNTATNDPTNLAPADWHQQSLTLGYTLPAIAALNGTTIGISATGVMNKHHVSAAGLAAEEAAGFTDSDGKTRYGVNYGPNINIPVSKGFAVFGSASYGAFDYFDNAPVPFYYDIIDFGIYKKFNSLLSLTADLNNLTQINRGGWPFVYPNTIHRIYFAIALDIHLAAK